MALSSDAGRSKLVALDSRKRSQVLHSRGQGMRERVGDGSICHGNTWLLLSYGAELSYLSSLNDSEHLAGLPARAGLGLELGKSRFLNRSDLLASRFSRGLTGRSHARRTGS